MGFTRGLVIGSIIGASVSMIANPDKMKSKGKKKWMKDGRSMFRQSGGIIGDIVDMFR